METTLNIIPLLVAGIIYLAYWVVVFTILYHLTRFGVGTQPKKFAAVFFLGAIILFCLSLVLFLNTDFSALFLK